MNENIKIFLEKVAADKELQEQFRGIRDPDKAYELAASVQSGFTKDEFVKVMMDIKAKMSRDLSDEDLEKAAGGGGVGDGEITAGIAHTLIATAEAVAEAGANAILSAF